MTATVNTHTAAKVKIKKKSTDRVGEDVAVGRQDVLCSDKRQQRREDFFQFLHIQVSPLHTSLIYAVGCAAQQIGLWVIKKKSDSSFYQTNISHIHSKYKNVLLLELRHNLGQRWNQSLGSSVLPAEFCRRVNVKMVFLRPVPNESGNLFGRSVNG